MTNEVSDEPHVELPAIRVRRLTRRFGNLVAVNAIDLDVRRGSLFGFLGPNGAGKSTTIKMLTGLLAPTAGDVRILGLSLRKHSIDVRRRIGVVPEDLCLFERLTGREFLCFAGRMHGLSRADVSRRANDLLRLMELERAPNAQIVEYSHGMKKKLSLAAALIHAPEVLFLDEPFEGIDAVSSRGLQDLLRDPARKGMTIFLTSHVLEIVEQLFASVAVIPPGPIVAGGPLEEMRKDENGQALSLEDFFISRVGGGDNEARKLSWLLERERE